ncbi:MAG TPA: dethiobiotin synthase [Acidimicrobiales bacterium]|nr:dethiobiotin synthase [Acidimicrobiales bacterium]
MARPKRLVVVVGTGTDVGKTYVTAQVIDALRNERANVAARKPAQSFDPSDDPSGYDAAVLGVASGESPETVCQPDRWYEMAMAPPMAADALARPSFTLEDLVEELRWPEVPVDMGFVETAGGLRSPIADDGDCLALVVAVMPDVVLLVADAGLGTINSVRLTMDALVRLPAELVVVLNRFDQGSELHQRNRAWLRDRDDMQVFCIPGDEVELARAVWLGD